MSGRPPEGEGASPAAAEPTRPGRAARRRARRAAPPLPQRDGLDAVRWQVPREAADGTAAREALSERYPALADPAATPLADRFAAGEVVDGAGRPWSADGPVQPGDELWFHRELRPEVVAPAELRILHRDEHLLVLDKPHDMATMPRGEHVLASALVRLRRSTGITTLVPLHRLDRRTAGVLAFGIRPEERSAYQQLFARGEVEKFYEARILPGAGCAVPTVPGAQLLMRDHLVKRRGERRVRVLPDEPNAETLLEVLADEPGPGRRVLWVGLRPRTGRTHQLRIQLAERGAAILGEDLYGPGPVDEPPEPLQLLARSLHLVDPHTGAQRSFTSTFELGSSCSGT